MMAFCQLYSLKNFQKKKNNAAAGYRGRVKIELLKGAGLLHHKRNIHVISRVIAKSTEVARVSRVTSHTVQAGLVLSLRRVSLCDQAQCSALEATSQEPVGW